MNNTQFVGSILCIIAVLFIAGGDVAHRLGMGAHGKWPEAPAGFYWYGVMLLVPAGMTLLWGTIKYLRDPDKE